MALTDDFDIASSRIYKTATDMVKDTLSGIYEQLTVFEKDYTWMARFNREELEISLEADAHWLKLSTGFGLLVEVSINPRMSSAELERLCEAMASDIEQLLSYGCEKVETYKGGKLVSTKFLINGKPKGATSIASVGFFGKKEIKKTKYAYPL